MISLEKAVVYDIETFPNAFTLDMECLNSDTRATWEISHYRDDRRELMQWFQWMAQTQTPMIGFNSIGFDYPVIHELFHNPSMTVEQIYAKAMSIIDGDNKFANMVWADNRFCPQIDLFKIYHMDNHAKSTSLKALQINMRSESVVDMPVEVGTHLTQEQVNELLIPYNVHDVQETKRFAHFSTGALEFRLGLIEQFGIDVLNWNDTKIGSRMMEQRLGDELCYDRSSGRKELRQTQRKEIKFKDIIFPYIKFEHPEFQRILEYIKDQVLTSTRTGGKEVIQTKGVFTDLHATVGGITFHYGTGGIHGSVSSQRFEATDEILIRDIDVASLYPSIAIVNGLAPAHLGARFVEVYADLPKERKKWQKEKGKKCTEANTLKLASNGVYGNSNNQYSVFYDPQFTMTVTVNGQLMLSMLAEKLITVPTLKIIQINTDGVTYSIHKSFEPLAVQYCKEWEEITKLVLEDADYSRMFIRDVNSYVAEDTDGNLKLKGAYWTPDAMNYHESISAAQPPAWHKDLSALVSTRAAVAAMVHGIDPELYIRMNMNPYDFMCRIKVKRSDQLHHGDEIIQSTSRYYVSTDGKTLAKVSPPAGKEGTYKRRNGVTQAEYEKVMNEVNWEWDERVCTKNKSKYEQRRGEIQAGFKTTVCNHVNDFSFDNVNYDWYVQEAKKLIV